MRKMKVDEAIKNLEIINKDGSINLGELSKYNGKTEVENAKMIASILAQKAEAYGIPQTIHFTCSSTKPQRHK